MQGFVPQLCSVIEALGRLSMADQHSALAAELALIRSASLSLSLHHTHTHIQTQKSFLVCKVCGVCIPISYIFSILTTLQHIFHVFITGNGDVKNLMSPYLKLYVS